MDLAWYEDKCFNQLKDNSTYKELSVTETKEFCTKTKMLIKHTLETYRKDLSYKEIQILLSKVDEIEIPNFYINPKIHKDPTVGRHSVSGTNWITGPISKSVAHFLQES